jgi:hypothetical protein
MIRKALWELGRHVHGLDGLLGGPLQLYRAWCWVGGRNRCMMVVSWALWSWRRPALDFLSVPSIAPSQKVSCHLGPRFSVSWHGVGRSADVVIEFISNFLHCFDSDMYFFLIEAIPGLETHGNYWTTFPWHIFDL